MTRLVYWYTPFAELSAEVDKFVREGNAHQSGNAAAIDPAKKKTYISCSGRNPQLAGINAGDRLYVVAHGDTLQGFLVGELKTSSVPTGYTNVGGVAALTVDQLIVRMGADGFTWDVLDVRIYACKAAVDARSFVPIFAKEIRRKNHLIVVYGYRGLLDRSTYPGNKKGKLMSGFAETDASKLRNRYAARPLPPPPPPAPAMATQPVAKSMRPLPQTPIAGAGRPLPDVPPPTTPPPLVPTASARPLPDLPPPRTHPPPPPHRFHMPSPQTPDPFDADPYGVKAASGATTLYKPGNQH